MDFRVEDLSGLTTCPVAKVAEALNDPFADTSNTFGQFRVVAEHRDQAIAIINKIKQVANDLGSTCRLG
jgi:uncharacterized protein YhfF